MPSASTRCSSASGTSSARPAPGERVELARVIAMPRRSHARTARLDLARCASVRVGGRERVQARAPSLQASGGRTHAMQKLRTAQRVSRAARRSRQGSRQERRPRPHANQGPREPGAGDGVAVARIVAPAQYADEAAARGAQRQLLASQGVAHRRNHRGADAARRARARTRDRTRRGAAQERRAAASPACAVPQQRRDAGVSPAPART